MNFRRVFRAIALIAIAGSLLLLFGGVGLVAPPVASAAFPGVNGKIAFASNYQIYVMNADGTGQTNLTGSLGGYQPAWSPDGSKIAFTRSVGSNHEIFVMNADGNGLKALTSSTSASVWNEHPAWSPDGSEIAFASNRDGNWEIYVMNADGTGQTNLTNNSGADSDPSWSPDGTQIAFASLASSIQGIYVMNAADGTGQTMLTGGYAANYQPDWSPDGTKIAFTSSRDGNREIYVMNAVAGAVPTRLTNNPLWDENPAWSPDGTKIAFDSGESSSFRIYVIDPVAGAVPTPLTDVGLNVQPSWGVPTANHYTFGGFLPPVDDLPTVNVVKAGAGVPIKFSLGGDEGLDIFAAGYPKSEQVSCESGGTVSVLEETVTAGRSSLSYDAATGQYTYIWRTDKAWAGSCRQFVLGLDDGTFYHANFQFKP